MEDGKTKPDIILIEIEVEWVSKQATTERFAVNIRYGSKQSIYAIPKNGWENFNIYKEKHLFPSIIYVPPFSGLEEKEQWKDSSVVKQHVGKFQPGSVIRNILLRVFSKVADSSKQTEEDKQNWNQFIEIINNLFSIQLLAPKYRMGIDNQILCEYKQNGHPKPYDLIAAGSGFHQTVILLSFFFWSKPDVILFDEPDAHLFVNLQRELVTLFKKFSNEQHTQFIIATHSEEFINQVETTQIISLLQTFPRRIEAKDRIIKALAEVRNVEITSLMQSPYILYVEGNDDFRIVNALANVLNKTDLLKKFFVKTMNGGSKDNMNKTSQLHFNSLREIIPEVKQIVLFDFDEEKTYHPQKNNPVQYEWQRKNIDNYILVSDVWKRCILKKLNLISDNIFSSPLIDLIDNFFQKNRLDLMKGESWKTVNEYIFRTIDGKKILFEDSDSLFQQIRSINPDLVLNREYIASQMTENEIHNDIIDFFEKLETI